MHRDAIKEIIEDRNPWWANPAARRVVPTERRDLFDRLLSHIGLVGGRRAALILGPRQVGKTTLLLQLADELLSQGWPPGNLTYFDFSDYRLTDQIGPGSILELEAVGATPDQPRVFLLDEISKSASWGSWLKQAVDTTPHRFLITDSAASLLRGEAIESGQGRWDEMRIEGLSFGEFLRFVAPGEPIQHTFRRIPNSIERYLAIGGFPEHAASEDYAQARERIREDIADRAILRDLLHLGLDVDRLRKLFLYLVQDSGAIFNASTRARDLGADPRSVAEWVRALEDSRLIAPLPRHTERPAARLRSQPKIYASDHGLVAAFTPRGSIERDQRARARVFEAVVFRHLRELANLVHGELSFYRRNEHLEADFVLTLEDRCIVIEVTTSPDPPRDKFQSLRRVGQQLRAARLVLIHGGIVDFSEEDVTPMPLARFLLEPEKLLEMKE